MNRTFSKCVFIALISFSAAGAAREPVIESILNSVLATVYHGDRSQTQRSVADLSSRYKRFVTSLTWQPQCIDQRPEIIAACKNFQSNELSAIKTGKWSEAYDFEKAAFSDTTGVYNFSKPVSLADDYRCEIFLQLSVDLPNQRVLSDEYWATCKFN